jgi:hypothetical protein
MYGLRLRLAALGGHAAEPVHLRRIARLETFTGSIHRATRCRAFDRERNDGISRIT